VKRVRYSKAANDALERYASMAQRIRRAVAAYAVGDGAHANQVKLLKGSPTKRLRVGDFRVVFVETNDEIYVVRLAPRGDVYD
jgi:mRNA interferase RelE/StbE